jgi:hypothetical protein
MKTLLTRSLTTYNPREYKSDLTGARIDIWCDIDKKFNIRATVHKVMGDDTYELIYDGQTASQSLHLPRSTFKLVGSGQPDAKRPARMVKKRVKPSVATNPSEMEPPVPPQPTAPVDSGPVAREHVFKGKPMKVIDITLNEDALVGLEHLWPARLGALCPLSFHAYSI